MSDKDPKEKKYMRENKETMQRPPVNKEGIEEPRVTGYRPLQIGLVIFIIIVIVVIIWGINSNMWGLFS